MLSQEKTNFELYQFYLYSTYGFNHQVVIIKTSSKLNLIVNHTCYETYIFFIKIRNNEKEIITYHNAHAISVF